MKEGCSKTIKELRDISQESRYESEGGMRWFERNFYRRFSIYITKFFLQLGISANTTTLLSLISALVGGLFLIFADNIFYLLTASVFLILYLILDRVDGEISRYNKTSSNFGAQFDFFTGVFVHAYVIASLALCAYAETNNIHVIGIGYLAVSVNLLCEFYRFASESKNDESQNTLYQKKKYKQLRELKGFLGPGAIIYPILFIVFLDIIISPTSILTNMKCIFLLFYSCIKSFALIKMYKKEVIDKLGDPKNE